MAGCRNRAELGRTGVYILVGYKEDDEDLPRSTSAKATWCAWRSVDMVAKSADAVLYYITLRCRATPTILGSVQSRCVK